MGVLALRISITHNRPCAIKIVCGHKVRIRRREMAILYVYVYAARGASKPMEYRISSVIIKAALWATHSSQFFGRVSDAHS